jgi:uncharacterized protein (DUF4415 family)
MPKRPDPGLIDEENPEWTEEDFARARPAREVLPSALYDALTNKLRGQRGPQKAPTKVAVRLRVDRDVLERFKAKGPGWQSRMNEALGRAAKRQAR